MHPGDESDAMVGLQASPDWKHKAKVPIAVLIGMVGGAALVAVMQGHAHNRQLDTSGAMSFAGYPKKTHAKAVVTGGVVSKFCEDKCKAQEEDCKDSYFKMLDGNGQYNCAPAECRSKSGNAQEDVLCGISCAQELMKACFPRPGYEDQADECKTFWDSTGMCGDKVEHIGCEYATTKKTAKCVAM